MGWHLARHTSLLTQEKAFVAHCPRLLHPLCPDRVERRPLLAVTEGPASALASVPAGPPVGKKNTLGAGLEAKSSSYSSVTGIGLRVCCWAARTMQSSSEKVF